MLYKRKKTKIVATVGPASSQPEILKQLIEHGVNVFRFNMKHGTVEEHHKNIQTTQNIADKLHVPVGILIDLQGPDIRIKTRDDQDVILKKEETVKFGNSFKIPDVQIRIPRKSVFKALEKGDKFLIDDGFIQMEVTEVSPNEFTAKIYDDGTIKNNKSLNLFKKDLKLPSLIKDDIDRLSIADSRKIDYVALSFARSKKDLDTLKRHMDEKGIKAQIVAKIESQAAIDNIDELVEYSDAVMIARGDLGVETPMESLAYYQKMIISKCRKTNTPVIVATQMLESMINNPIPTRAEATDVANAVLDGTDAIMLSGETAIGKYPVKAVAEMARIAIFNEEKSDVVKFDITPQNATELIVDAAKTIAENAKNVRIDHIIVMTETGYTAKVLSSFRPKIPILAVTDRQKTVETLTLSYGIIPIRMPLPSGVFISPEYVLKELKKSGKIKANEQVLLIHGQHWKQPGQTNAIVLVRVK